MLNTDIYEQKVVHYLVLGKTFFTETQAREYVKTIEEYNQKYLSSDDPVEPLLKLIDEEIKPNSSFYYHIVLAGLRKNIYSKTLYIDEPLIYDCIRNLHSCDCEIILCVYNELVEEYIKKYGYKRES